MTNLQHSLNFEELNVTPEEIITELYERSINYKRRLNKEEKKTFINPKFMNFSFDYLYQGLHRALLFGKDNRCEVASISHLRQHNQWSQFSKGVAGVINSELLIPDEGNSVKLAGTPPTMRNRMIDDKGVRLMDSSPFLLQPSIVTGTAFLVSDDIVLSAYHVVKDRNPSNNSIGLSFIFNFKYNNDHEINAESFLDFDVYKGISIIEKAHAADEDWALVKLDRKVSGYQKILPIHFDFDYRIKTPVCCMGHPEGLPMKFNDDAKITRIDDHFVESSLDTFWGNSGSPVLAEKDGEPGVIGIMCSTSGTYVPLSDQCVMYRPQQFDVYKDRINLHMRFQKINNRIKQFINQ